MYLVLPFSWQQSDLVHPQWKRVLQDWYVDVGRGSRTQWATSRWTRYYPGHRSRRRRTASRTSRWCIRTLGMSEQLLQNFLKTVHICYKSSLAVALLGRGQLVDRPRPHAIFNIKGWYNNCVLITNRHVFTDRLHI